MNDSLFRVRHFPLTYQKSCLLMGSQWVSSQELPWAEEILKPSPQRCPCWLPEYIEGLASSSFASFWHGSEGLSLLQISPLEDLAGLRCRGIELPTLPNPAYFMASLIVLRALSASQRSQILLPVLPELRKVLILNIKASLVSGIGYMHHRESGKKKLKLF